MKRAASSPIRFCRALALACSVGRKSQRGMLRHVAYLAEACVLRDWLSRVGIEHVHAHFGTNPAMVAMLCQAVGGPRFSFTVHGPEEFDRPEMLGLPEKIRRAAFVVAVSEFGRSQLCRWCGQEQWPKLHVVHCGVDEKYLDHELTPVPPEPRLLCVGRLCEQKGQLVLIEAAAALKAAGVSFQLVFIGDGPMRGQIEELIHRHGLDGSVTLAGWQSGEAVRAAILSSRAMVLPSFAEGLPVVLMESLALGRPVVSTFVAGIPELVEPGKSGWLVPAGSADALANAMREAIECPASRLTEMGQHGAKRVAVQHRAAAEAAKLARLLANGLGC